MAQAADAIIARERATIEADINGRLDALAESMFGKDDSKQAKRYALLSAERAGAERSLVAATLLRLLAGEGSLGTDGAFNARAHELFDDLFSGRGGLYGAVGVDPKSQTFEKTRILRDVAPTAERAFLEIQGLLQRLTDVPHARTELMKLIRSSLGEGVITPFLPVDFRSRTDDLFRAVDSYMTASGEDTITARARAETEFRTIEGALKDAGTTYATTLTLPIIAALKRLVDADYESNPATKPAEIELEAASKRYPLAETTQCLVQARLVNQGPGVAFETVVEVAETEGVTTSAFEVIVGELSPGVEVLTIPATTAGTGRGRLLGRVRWKNADGEERHQEFFLELEPQVADVDWQKVVGRDPYAPEPVSTEHDLVGRRQILSALLSQAGGHAVGSSFVTGQKRVGKTSIARTLASQLAAAAPDSSGIVLETGDIVRPEAGKTVAALGQLLAKRVVDSDPRLAHLPLPTFDDALAPLTEFFDAVKSIAHDRRFVFIIDEFDELPLDVYRRGGVGDSLFLTLRALSGRDYVGFVLVGGEKIDFILKHQGERLNKFETLRVDYFDRSREWADFSALARSPVEGVLEFSEDAIDRLYEWSAGNPFFAKLICRSMLELAAERRDAHITSTEIDEAARAALGRSGIQNFQHFWNDGISEEGDLASEVADRRRKVILAVGEATRAAKAGSATDYKTAGATEAAIAARAAVYGVNANASHDEIRDLLRRGVLTRVQDNLACRVPYFSAWLQDYGVEAIITSFGDSEAVFVLRRSEEAGQITSSEVLALTDRWGIYRGRKLTEDQVRAWLRQFGDNVNQRLMYRILDATRFYGGDAIREKLREAHAMIERQTVAEARQRPRRRYVLSHVGGPAKSGAFYARLYAQENRVGMDNVVGRADLPAILQATTADRIRALVFAEDFIGTGGSIADAVSEVASQCGELLSRNDIPVFFVAVAGFNSGIANARSSLAGTGLRGDIVVPDLLGDEAMCFSRQAGIFANDQDRELARSIAYERGAELERRYPLGFGDCQAAVVFEQSCPNNSLPILWQKANEWRPLFPRF